MIRVQNVRKTYGDAQSPVLRDISFHVPQKQSVAVWGPSGGGKTTLLNLLGGLDRAYSGSISLLGKTLETLSDRALSGLRGRNIGFVFQSPPFFEHLRVEQNLLLPARFAGVSLSGERIEGLLSDVGLSGFAGRFPHELSGGQLQRLALARACVADPALLLCDEPTGNLDPATGQAVLDLILERVERGMTVMVVTHNREVAARCARVFRIEDGLLTEARP